MRKLSFIVSALFALALLVAPQQAAAQTSVEVGPRIGLDFGDIEEFFIGAEGRIISDALPVIVSPAFDYYFDGVENFSIFTFDLNALYEFGVDNQAFTPYAGGGLGFIRSSVDAVDVPGFGSFGGGSSTEVGLNLVGGARFETGSLKPFVQAKITVSDATLFGVMGGLLFSF